MNFKLTTKTQIQALGGLIYMTVVFIIIFLIFIYAFESFFVSLLSLVPLYLIFYVLPVLVLHQNYLKYARGTSLSLLEDCIVLNGRSYNVNEIILVEVFSTYQHKNKVAGAYTLSHSEYYYYIKLNMKEGTPIILNSLLGQNIDHIMKKNYPSLNIQYRLHSFFGLMIYESSFTKKLNI